MSKDVIHNRAISPPSSSKSLVDITNIHAVISRFNGIFAAFPKEDILTNNTLLTLIFADVTEPTKDEMDVLTEHFRKEMSKALKHVPSRSNIEKKLHEYFNIGQLWQGNTYIGEEEGRLYVLEKKEKKYITNFTLHPKHTIVVQGKGGKKIHSYLVRVLGSTRVGNILLTSDNFNTLPELQKQLAQQVGNLSPRINGCANYMNDLGYKYIDLPDWGTEKQGTSLLGMEVLPDGGKYFCTPHNIYDLSGNISEDIVAMGNNEANKEEVNNWTNLNYAQNAWEQTIKTFIENVLYVNDRSEMLLLLGWMCAIPHDYVIRKESKTGYFPHCQIVGEPGAGKSTIMTLLKQYMGHNDSSLRAFPSPFELGKLLNTSYTIPVVMDEYGKRWKPDHMDAINKVMIESYMRSYYSKGTANQDSIYYKHKNPLMYGGQMPTRDKALSERVVDVRIKKSFQTSSSGVKARQHLETLQFQEDKNFWVGYNLWCAKHTNSEVLSTFNTYRKVALQHIRDERVANGYAVVMMGLHYVLKLSKEIGASTDLCNEDILSLPARIKSSGKIEDMEEFNVLHKFLRDVAQFGVQYGNKSFKGQIFGAGLSVSKVVTTTSPEDPGFYGKHKSQACIYGNDLMLMKIDNLVSLLNKDKDKNDKYVTEEIMTFIDAEFNISLENAKSKDESLRRKSLVLAPKSFKTRYGNHTAFNLQVLLEEYPEFEQIDWTNMSAISKSVPESN